MHIEHDPSLVFIEQTIGDGDALNDAQIHISHNSAGYTFVRSNKTGVQLATVNEAMTTLESALTKWRIVRLDMPK